MEDFPILLIVLIVYLIAVSGSKKKARSGDARAAQRMATRSRRGRTEQTERQEKEAFHAAFAGVQDKPESKMPERAHREASPEPVRAEALNLEGIPEGEDACHPAREMPEPEEAPWLSADEAAFGLTAADGAAGGENALAEDVLRGIIMSEILTRPCERRARNRQGYHGQ